MRQEDGFLDAEITGGLPPDVAGVSERVCVCVRER